MKNICYAAALGVALALASCSGNEGWTVQGTVDGGADKTVYVEASNVANWYVVDSLKLDGDGNFEYQSPAAAPTQTIYRLRMDGKYIYFPIDSAEVITVKANAAKFDRAYSLDGSVGAKMFAHVDSLIGATIDAKGPKGALADQDMKNQLSRVINQDSTCIVSYYVIGKFIDGAPLYNLNDRHDVNILGNAANNYDRMRPTDKRAAELKERYTAARRAVGKMPVRTVEVQGVQAGRPSVDIKLYDRVGKIHDFNDVVGHGRVVILNFTRYDGQASQANTMALNQAYSAHKGDLDIYQIAYDADELSWRESAANMPWIAVFCPQNQGLDIMAAYNVDPIHGGPVSFIFNRQGDLVKRVSAPTELAASLAGQF